MKKNLNTKEYWDNFFKASRFQKRHCWRVKPYERIWEALCKHGIDIKDKWEIVDLGCAFGDGLQYLKHRLKKCSYKGIDFSDECIIWARKNHPGFKFEVDDIYTLEIETDVIIVAETLEHLDNDMDVLERLKKMCKVLIIAVPNKEKDKDEGLHKMHLHSYSEESFVGAKTSTNQDYLIAIYEN